MKKNNYLCTIKIKQAIMVKQEITRLGSYRLNNLDTPYPGDQGSLKRMKGKREAAAYLGRQQPHDFDRRQRMVRIRVEDDGTYGVAHIIVRDNNLIKGYSRDTCLLGTKKNNIPIEKLSKYRHCNPDFYSRRKDGVYNMRNVENFKAIDKLNKNAFINVDEFDDRLTDYDN